MNHLYSKQGYYRHPTDRRIYGIKQLARQIKYAPNSHYQRKKPTKHIVELPKIKNPYPLLNQYKNYFQMKAIGIYTVRSSEWTPYPFQKLPKKNKLKKLPNKFNSVFTK